MTNDPSRDLFSHENEWYAGFVIAKLYYHTIIQQTKNNKRNECSAKLMYQRSSHIDHKNKMVMI